MINLKAKKIMDRNKIAIATMTWVRDQQEELLLRESLTLLAQEKIPTFITDKSSDPEFLEFLDGFSNFHIFKDSGSLLFPQVKQSLQAAINSGAEFVLYTEPDKRVFFDGGLADFILKAPSDDSPGIILAARSPASFATFPAFQQYTETVINNLCTEITGQPNDYTYGPFLINRNLADCLDLVDDQIGWGWRTFLFAIAQYKGVQIRSFENDYSCPLEQRKADSSEKIYRMKQLRQSIDGLIAGSAIS